jgi:hypothetical protein
MTDGDEDRVEPRTGNAQAIAAFVAGLISLPLFPFFVVGMIAVFLGAQGRKNARDGAGLGALATWGMALGIVSWILLAILVVGAEGL